MANQHHSPKRDLLLLLAYARDALRRAEAYAWSSAQRAQSAAAAQAYLDTFRRCYAAAPASTRRRWKAGR